jgi:hypothetical protein
MKITEKPQDAWTKISSAGRGVQGVMETAMGQFGAVAIQDKDTGSVFAQ